MKAKKNSLRGIKDCLKLLFKYDKKYLFISIIMAIFQGVIPTFTLTISQQILNTLQKNQTTIKYLVFLLSIYAMLNVIPSLIISIYSYYRTKFNKNFEKYIDELLLKKILKLNLKDFEDDEVYDMINRAKSQRGINLTTLFENSVNLVKEIISIVSLIVLLSKFNVWLILIVIIVPIINSLFSVKFGKEQYDIVYDRTYKERKLWYIDHLVSKGQAYKEIKLFNIGNKLLNYYLKLKTEIIKQDLKVVKKTFWTTLLCMFFDSVIDAMIIGYIIFQGFLKKILIGDTTVYIQAVQSIKSNVESIFTLVSTIIQESFYINLFFDLLEYNISDTPDELLGDKFTISNIEHIKIENLSYKYPESDCYALENINLEISKGESIALVGRNGSGKTTLIKILMGFYDNYEGVIKINGINFKKIDKQSYRDIVSSVFQDYIKYEATLRENVSIGLGISLGESNENIDSKILEVIKKTNLKSSIYKENGLDTILGTWFGKTQLSMGEWQRLAISRALLKNADLYIFDEPDASLDAEAESQLLNLYKSTFKDKIGIFITHNISTASKITDNIVVLDNGSIAERGNHKELLCEQGIYSKLFYSNN
ncbi:ABC transporter ATP-binding protein [Terrisporobacter muris]|uniref:ABC transporter ATP-binding protein/permease n=1 Tax=Terrisporobacter muris TaxID=2963284 RepID=A0A9X2S5T5_9FIRM|nr:ABC transporter ATP-binding protein [Terrisporobacter muris]MCR1825001.1 ABC transporter ATP-binding protein/permease [Terrisporobacter muris]